MAYLIVLLAAVFHAVWHSMIKHSPDKLMTLASIRLVGVTAGVVLAVYWGLPKASVWPYLLSAATLHFVYFYFMINTYRLGDFSKVYPISRGVAPVLVLLLAMLFVDERLSVWQLSATLLISFGILCLAKSSSKLTVKSNRPTTGGDRSQQTKAVLYALFTGVAIAGYTFISGLGVREADSFWRYIGWLEAITGIGVWLFVLLRPSSRQLLVGYACQHWQFGLTAGILSVTSFGAAIWAMQNLPMAPVTALRETSIIFGALIGVFFLREVMSFWRVCAAILVALGVSLLGLGA